VHSMPQQRLLKAPFLSPIANMPTLRQPNLLLGHVSQQLVSRMALTCSEREPVPLGEWHASRLCLLFQINLWMGCAPDGSSSGLHHDFHDNLYVSQACVLRTFVHLFWTG
jgi:hypothetical protein